MITVKNLKKTYGTLTAVNDVSFHVKKGSFFALLGPNGAGKSTTIEILATLKEKNEGVVTIDGLTLGTDDAEIRKKIGVVFQYSTLDEDLTVRENLKIRSALYRMGKETFDARLEELNAVMELEAILSQRVKTLSGGQRRKADIARALLHNPSILILDEPTTGLDPKSRQGIWQLVMALKEKTNMTLFLTTHYMEEVSTCDHVIIMHKGLVRAEDSADNLRKTYARDTLKLFPKEGLRDALTKEKVPFTPNHSTLTIELADAFQGLEIVKRFETHIDSFEIIKARMDDVFLNITGETLEEAGEL